jgi:CHAD domain-containing protein
MAFELSPGRPISKQLPRLARKGLRRAVEGIDRKRAADAAVHDARKSVKKVRAILRLLERPLGRHYAADNDRLRKAARQLSNLRDADAMLQTFAALCATYAAILTSSIQSAVNRGLRSRRRALWRRAGTFVRRALRDLRRARRTVPERIETCARASAARTGYVRGYRRARAAMAPITMASDAAEFHRWRRRVKDHWYHVRLFAPRHRSLTARAQSLRRLETDLGDDHDLAVLRDVLLGEPEKFGRAKITAIVLGCIEKRQHTLRRLAISRGRRLFASSARRFRASAAGHLH